jgi:hypothetical protein
MKEVSQKEKYIRKKELHPSFQVDQNKFHYAQYDKRTPVLFKADTTNDKL